MDNIFTPHQQPNGKVLLKASFNVDSFQLDFETANNSFVIETSNIKFSKKSKAFFADIEYATLQAPPLHAIECEIELALCLLILERCQKRTKFNEYQQIPSTKLKNE